MKRTMSHRLVLGAVAGMLSLSSYGQTQVDKVVLEQRKKDKQKNDEAILDAKKNVKAQLWMDRGALYDEFARQYPDVDSMASFTAIEAYKKAVTLDTKDGKVGSLAKKAAGYLKGEGKEDNINLQQGLMQQGAGKFQNKSYLSAFKYFAAAEEIFPKDTLAALYAGYSAVQGQKNADCKIHLEKYIDNGGKDPGVFALLSNVYSVDKEWDKAITVLDKAIKIAPPSTVASVKAEKVNVYINAERKADAKVVLAELVELDNKNTQYPTNLAILNDNEATEFQTELKKINEKSGGVAKAKKVLEDEKSKAEVYVGEQKRINDLLKKQPKSADLKRQLADVQKLMGESKAKADEAAKAVTTAEEAVKSLGDVAAKTADLTQKMNTARAAATKYYKKALDVDPKSFDALFNLGVFYFNDAVEIKKTVDGMDMKDYSTKGKEVEGRVCGRFKQAISYFERAKQVREDEIASENLKNAQAIVAELEKNKVTCVDAQD